MNYSGGHSFSKTIPASLNLALTGAAGLSMKDVPPASDPDLFSSVQQNFNFMKVFFLLLIFPRPLGVRSHLRDATPPSVFPTQAWFRTLSAQQPPTIPTFLISF